MNFKHLLVASLLMSTGSGFARDVHGVNGFYNWTAAQMEADANLQFGPEGFKWAQWNPSYKFEGDYLKWMLGVHNTNFEAEKGGFQFRSRLDWREKIAGEGFMVMTPQYPVFVAKISVPMQTEAKKNNPNNWWTEFFWHNPYTGAQDVDMPNNNGGGFWGFSKALDVVKASCPWVKDELGRDSIYLYNCDKNDPTVSIRSNGGAGNTAQENDTVWYMKRLPVTYDKEKCEIIVAVNFASIRDTSKLAVESHRLIDRVPIKLSHFSLGCITRADTMFVERDENGDTLSTRAKTPDEVPCVYVKWIKTYPSMDAVIKSLTEENNWGDGPVENPQKGVLNTTLYKAEKIVRDFVNYDGDGNDQYAALKQVCEEGNDLYEKEDATTEEYVAEIKKIEEAISAFYSMVNPSEDLVYNYVRTADASTSLYATSEEVTKDGYTGRLIALGANEAALPLTFIEVGSVNGQRSYQLKSAEGVVVQCTDGTLMLVDNTNNAATFTSADHDGYELFDMKCGSYYYYKKGFELSVVKEFPEVNYDDMQPYLFMLEDALADYKESATAEEKENLFEAWEFNGEAEEDPSTKGMLNGVQMTMGENGQTFMLDGWRMQRWRMWSRVNKGTYETDGGEELSCLKLTAAETYDSFDGTSTGNETVYPASPSMRREGGIYTNFYDRDPKDGVRDESCLVNFNPAFGRYLAIKCKGTNEEITIDKLNFLRKGDSPATDFAVTLADAEMKGDVYYWDLLKYISVGKMPYVGQYLSSTGFQKDDALYIDWIRTYESVDDIPTESFATAVNDVKEDNGELKVFVTGNTINIFTEESGNIYTVDGICVAEFNGTAHETVQPGIYIIRAGSESKKVMVK